MKQVTEFVYRGPRPACLADLKDAGISNVINLQSGAYEKLHDDQYEHDIHSNLPAMNGMIISKLHFSDVSIPKYEDVMMAVRMLERAQSFRRKIYVHCLHGKDRTGYVIAAYRMSSLGWTWREAVAEMFREGFHKWSYLWWVPSLRKYAKK